MAEHEARIKRNEDDIQDLWSSIESIKTALQYRLPLWATFLISGLSAALGSVITAYLHK